MVPLANALTGKSRDLQEMKLDLTGNNLTDCGENTLFTIDSALRFVSSLVLSKDNKIGEEGVRSIMTTLSVGGPSGLYYTYGIIRTVVRIVGMGHYTYGGSTYSRNGSNVPYMQYKMFTFIKLQ